MLKFHGSPKYTSIKYRKTWKFRRAFFKPVSFHRSPWKPRVWHARFKVSVRYNCGIIMFPHGSEPRGRRVWRRSATYDRTRPPHIESQGGLCRYSRFSVRFLLASQPDRSQGEPRANGSEWKIDGQIIIARGNEWKRWLVESLLRARVWRPRLFVDPGPA